MKTLVAYALSHVGLPYIWGGDDSVGGYDCSGFVQELLASVGQDPPGDQTAHGLYLYFKGQGVPEGFEKLGGLAFYGSTDRITHVGMVIARFRIIEAGGGNHRTKTRDDAIKQNAYIRIRPVNYRSDLVTILHPRYANIAPR